ncbi:MAG TPA: helix-turn-helix transcriptional regulator [Ktedonobacteraceae bacterium]|nr:helix-turn-helix transcriptional regulator [Ktedonobacteraceae bacterium]
MSMKQGKFPNNLRACIKESGYTIQEIAQEADIPLRTLFDYCGGKTPIPRKRLEILANLLGYPAEAIVPVNNSLSIIPLKNAKNMQEIVPTLSDTHEVDKPRRELLQQAPSFVSVALMTSPNILLNEDLLQRFSNALTNPSSTDEITLNYLEIKTASYWRDRHSAIVASSYLFSYVVEHLQRVIILLERPSFPSMRTRLCCIASGIAQLAGHLLFDMSEFARARSFHQLAITAAQEGQNQALEAVAWARMSFTWTYSGNPLEALRCIQEARRITTGNVNVTVRAYLAAVEAEIEAILGNSKFCLKLLEIAEHVEDLPPPGEEIYWLHFDRSRFAGYQGTCFKRLYNPEDSKTYTFLRTAQNALTDALTLLDPARLQRRPTLLIDLAGTYAQQGDVEGACEYAVQALSIMAQTKSRTVAKRLLALQQKMETWKDTSFVKNLDQQIASLVTSDGIEVVHE